MNYRTVDLAQFLASAGDFLGFAMIYGTDLTIRLLTPDGAPVTLPDGRGYLSTPLLRLIPADEYRKIHFGKGIGRRSEKLSAYNEHSLVGHESSPSFRADPWASVEFCVKMKGIVEVTIPALRGADPLVGALVHCSLVDDPTANENKGADDAGDRVA